MERRRKAVARRPASRVVKPATDPQDPILSLLPNIAELINFGGITVGQMEPVGCRHRQHGRWMPGYVAAPAE